MTITVEIPGRPPTPNARRHWRSIAKDNAEWKAIAIEAAEKAIAAEYKPPRMTVARLDVTFVVSTRARRDFDNLLATLKPLIDGCVTAGVIVDDSTDVLIGINAAVAYQKGETATILTFRGTAL